jgi:predicted aspartyl protease
VNKPQRHKKSTFPLIQIVVLSFLLTLSNKNYSQEEAKQPPHLLTSFHFSMLTGGIIIVDALIDNYPDTLHFVLDTGSGGISLDSTTASALNLPLTLSDRTIKGIAGIRKVSFVTDRTLKLPGLSVEHLNFHVTDYDLLTSVYGTRIDGIIGYSFLKRYIVKIDYEKNVIEVWPPGKIKYPRGGYLIRPAITSIPVFEAKIRDGSSRGGSFYFDTGAGLCLLMSEDYERDSSILKKKNKKITYTQVEGLGGKKPLKITTVAEVKVGPYRFRKVPTYIFKDDYNVTSYPLLGGLIGNDLLRRFNLIINYDENEIHLLPNSHYNEQFDYSYTGLGIYMVNGQIVIEDVIEGSPGDLAGLKPGDVIFAINNSFNKGIQEYKSMLQTVGARLKIIVLRDGLAIVSNLKVKSIL